MITYNPKQWFGLIFRFHKSDTFRQLFWVLFFFALCTAGLVYAELHFKMLYVFSNTIQIHSLLGFVIGLLLVFRTNSAYDRWWEARKLWGSMVNNSRNLAIKINAMLPAEDKANRDFFTVFIPNYVFAMKEHLRDGVKIEEIESHDDLSTKSLLTYKHQPNKIASKMYERLQYLYTTKKISGDQLITIDGELKAFTEIIGACERIKNTPIPFSYNLFLKKFIFAYTITLPFGLAHDFHYWTIPISCFILYIFGSLELLAEEIEDPFGTDTNDLPTDDLAIKIKGNVAEILN
ncbi:MAG: bestrophin family ion channel [Vicingaceae bacterium]